MANIKPIAKAVVGAATAFVGVLVGAATDGHITLAEWLVAVGAGLGALGVVFRVPNASKAVVEKKA